MRSPKRPPRPEKPGEQPAPAKLSRGTLKLLAVLGGGVVLFCCCATAGVGGWWHFFLFTGNELVGTWENDRSETAREAYVRARFGRTGSMPLAEPSRMVAGQGTWRVLSKQDNVYTLEIANHDGKLKAQAVNTMLDSDRMRFVCPQLKLNVELKRLE
jgi:hypothetical protein